MAIEMTEESLLRAMVADPGAMSEIAITLGLYLENVDHPRSVFAKLFQSGLRTYFPDNFTAGKRARDLILAGMNPCAPTFTNSIGMRLALIPPGVFWMGSPSDLVEWFKLGEESPIFEEITLPFFLGVTPVTQAEYQRVMGVNPSMFDFEQGDGIFANPAQFPVTSVSWDEAIEFCARLSESAQEKAEGRTYRLPTEAEWEYACQGGIGWGPPDSHNATENPPTPFFFGDTLRGLALCQRQDGELMPASPGVVASYRPNNFGLYDMHGNIFEWCADWYESPYGRIIPAGMSSADDRQYLWDCMPELDRSGPESGDGHVIRGGSWADTEGKCRTASRSFSSFARETIGFRVACLASRNANARTK